MAILLIGQMNSLLALQEAFLIFLFLSTKPSFCSKGWSDKSVPRGGLSLKDLADSEGLTKLFASDGYFTDTSQENVKPFGGIKIQYEAQKLSASLRWISNDEIGVTTMQAIYDTLPYTEVPPTYRSRLKKITDIMKERFKDYLQIVQTNKIIVQNLYKFHVKQPITLKYDCCRMNTSDFHPDNQYRCPVSRRTSCDLLPYHVTSGAFNPGRNLTEVWKSNMNFFPTIKWQFFISTEGVHNEYPANGFQWSNCLNVHDMRHSLIKSHAVQEDLDWEIKVANVDEKKWDFSMRKGVLEPTILNKKRFSMS